MPRRETRPSPERSRPGARLLAAIEAMGVRSTRAFWALVPPELVKRVRPQVEPVGDGLLTLSGSSDALRMNRVIGLGHLGRAREEMIDGIIERFRAARLGRFSVVLSPGPQVAEITEWLTRRGLERHGGYALLVRDARRPVPSFRPRLGLKVARAGRKDAEAVVSIHEQAFFSPASRRSWALAGATMPGIEQYLVWSGRVPVAAGSLRIDGRLAWLGGGATLTSWRRHGAHAALIAARLRRAARAGCRWVWVETADPEPGRPAGSNRNLIRMGFEPAFVKPIFVWSGR
jgi:hypothetical protein